MSNTERTPEDLKAIEASFASLKPATGALARDRLMFEAGRASNPPLARSISRLTWPAATSGLMAVSVALAAILVFREPKIVERVVYRPAHAETETIESSGDSLPSPSPGGRLAASADAPPDGDSRRPLLAARSMHALVRRGGAGAEYLTLRDDLLAWGPDALRGSRPAAGVVSPPAVYRDLRDALFGPPANQKLRPDSIDSPSTLPNGADS